jgi:outer membrane protein TolC
VQLNLLKVLAAALDDARRLQKAGEAREIDALLLTVDLRQVEMNLQRVRAMLEGHYENLAAVVGAPGLVVTRMAGDLLLSTPEFDEAVIREYLATLHTSLQIAELDVDRNQILLKRAQVDPYPNPILGPAYNYGLTPGIDQFWLNLTFPSRCGTSTRATSSRPAPTFERRWKRWRYCKTSCGGAGPTH